MFGRDFSKELDKIWQHIDELVKFSNKNRTDSYVLNRENDRLGTRREMGNERDYAEINQLKSEVKELRESIAEHDQQILNLIDDLNPDVYTETIKGTKYYLKLQDEWCIPPLKVMHDYSYVQNYDKCNTLKIESGFVFRLEGCSSWTSGDNALIQLADVVKKMKAKKSK